MAERYVLKCDFHEASRVWDSIYTEVRVDFTRHELARLRLGLTELINNVIEHSLDGPNASLFQLKTFKLDRSLFLIISHDGKPFHMMEEDINLDTTPSGEGSRGRGLYLIGKCFSEVRYRNRGNVQRIIAKF